MLKSLKSISPLIKLHFITHNDKQKLNFRNIRKFIKKEKLTYHIDISIQTLCDDTWNLAHISLDHHLILLFLYLD